MSSRFGKLLLILLVPVLLLAALKGFLHYKATRAVEDIVVAMSNQAKVSYQGIDTELLGAVTVRGITVQPLGYDDEVTIDALRVATDDPVFFLTGADWQSESGPPESMSFAIDGISVPLTAQFLPAAETPEDKGCAEGLQVEPKLLRKIGFTELTMDTSGHYRLDKSARRLEFGMNSDVHDVQSFTLDAAFADVDVQNLSRGGGAPPSLEGFDLTMRMSPEFGRRALQACAANADQPIDQLAAQQADRVLSVYRQAGLTLGSGLQAAVHDFYRNWGEFRIRANPQQPVGLMSLMFLPPTQLADTLALTLTMNGKTVTDTRFSWDRPTAEGLAGLFGREKEQNGEASENGAPRRIIVRREYEDVPVAEIHRYVDKQVKIKPKGQPDREGVLKRVSDGQAEVEQSLQGGKFTVYVPLNRIESMQALIAHELSPD